MSDDRAIHLPDKSKLHWLKKSYKNFLGRTTLLYGRTKSGKSVLIEEIMYLCKDFIPTVFVISPTNAANGTYTGKVPGKCIKKELSPEFIESLLTRQKNVSEMCNIAKELPVLKSLFDLVADERSLVLERKSSERADNSVIFIDESSMSFSNNLRCFLSVTYGR